jgi:hypothetical protein
MQLLISVADLRIPDVTEFIASALAAFAMVFGVGKMAFNGYKQGKCALPRTFVLWVNLPIGTAMIFRVITFLLDEKYYWFFISVDVVGALLSVVILAQLGGYFLRKQ